MHNSSSFHWMLPLAVALSISADALFAPAKGLKVDKKFEANTEFALDDWNVVMNGEEVPAEYLPKLELKTTQSYTLSIADEHLKASDGRPTELRRTFGEFKASSNRDATMNGAPMSGASERKGTSKLDGCVVHYQTDGSKKIEKGECDSKIVAEVPIDFDFAALVADASPESSKVDVQAFSPLTFGLAQIDLDWDSPAGDDHAPEEQLVKNLHGEWRVTRGEVRKVDDRELVPISIEGRFDTRSSRNTKLEHIPDLGGDAVETCEMLLSAKGEILWDSKLHIATHASIAVDRKAVFKTVRVTDASDSRTYEQVMNFSGPAKFTFDATIAK